MAMDAEAVLFIHDLVINYVKEKDQGIYCRLHTSVLSLFSPYFLFNWLINHGYGRLSHVFRCVPLKVMGIELA